MGTSEVGGKGRRRVTVREVEVDGFELGTGGEGLGRFMGGGGDFDRGWGAGARGESGSVVVVGPVDVEGGWNGGSEVR